MSEKSVRIRREQNNGPKVIKTEAVINAVAQSTKLIIFSQACNYRLHGPLTPSSVFSR